MGVRMKLNPLRDNIAGKRLVVIDDSIVRGTTMVQLVRMLRQAGAAEVHVRINSPEVVWPCFYGIDTDVQAQLISANKTVEEICAYIGADSLAFLSVQGLLACMPPCGTTPEGGVRGYCTACFTGVYPVAIPESFGRDKFMPGYDPCNLTQPTVLPRDVVEQRTATAPGSPSTSKAPCGSSSHGSLGRGQNGPFGDVFQMTHFDPPPNESSSLLSDVSLRISLKLER